jgi:hypothetical protein
MRNQVIFVLMSRRYAMKSYWSLIPSIIELRIKEREIPDFPSQALCSLSKES